MLKENLRMSWENIRNNKMRSFLTSLGIIIGVGAVIALITIIQGVTVQMMAEFEGLGAGKVTVMATGTPLKRGLTEGDLEKLAALDNVSGVAPALSLSGTAGKQGAAVLDSITIEGKSELYFASDDITLAAGRGLLKSDMGGHQYVCVIDETLAETVFGNSAAAVGQRILLNGQGYQVVGVTRSEDDDMMSMAAGFTSGDDGSAVIPYKNAMSLSGASHIMNVEVYLADTTLNDETVTEIEAVLDEAFNYKDDSYSIMNLDSLLSTMESMQSMLASLLAGIASISLIVGGIGIMNMMLVSVTERTREIGLRKALGAEPARIQIQFVMEAISLSLIGGAAGILIGLGISAVAGLILGTGFHISWGAIGLGVGFSLAVGVIFGWAPAKKASALKPIDALRSE